MTNYEKFLSTKPTNIYTTNEVAAKYGISRGRVQDLFKILEFQKDSAHIYLVMDKELKIFEALLKLIRRTPNHHDAVGAPSL